MTITVYIHVDDYDEDIPADEQDYISENEAESAFDDMLDDCYEVVNVAGMTFTVATILKNTDPIAYREMYLNWLDSEFVSAEIDWEAFVNGL